MPMKCVVCGQLTDAEARLKEATALNERLTAELSEARFSYEHECKIYEEACAELRTAELAIAERDAAWRWAVKESRHGITHWEGCPCAALHKLMEGADAQKP